MTSKGLFELDEDDETEDITNEAECPNCDSTMDKTDIFKCDKCDSIICNNCIDSHYATDHVVFDDDNKEPYIEEEKVISNEKDNLKIKPAKTQQKPKPKQTTPSQTTKTKEVVKEKIIYVEKEIELNIPLDTIFCMYYMATGKTIRESKNIAIDKLVDVLEETVTVLKQNKK